MIEPDSYGTFVRKVVGKNRRTSVSLPEILRQTTMEEFLEAIERVKASQLLTEDFSGSNINNGRYLHGQRNDLRFPNTGRPVE